MKYKIISMFTNDNVYLPAIKRLEKSLIKFQIDYKIYKILNKGSWEKNTDQKAQIILQAMNEFPNKNIIFTDADSELLIYPELFNKLDCDVAYHILKATNELLTGTIYFANNEENRQLINDWIKLNSENHRWEQKNLQFLLENKYMHLKVNHLPAEYCNIYDNKNQSVSKPVIIHYQASRQSKKRFWEGDQMKNIIPQNGKSNPEGWDPVEIISNILKDLSYNSILDYGCGYGRLCRAFDDNKYLGYDFNKEAIKKARKIHSDYQFIDTIDVIENYDLLFAYTTFLHLADNELEHELEIFATLTNKYIIIAEILGREWRRTGIPPVYNRDKDDYIQILKNHKFKLIKEISKQYSHYANNSRFANKNTNLSFLIFERTK